MPAVLGEILGLLRTVVHGQSYTQDNKAEVKDVH